MTKIIFTILLLVVLVSAASAIGGYGSRTVPDFMVEAWRAKSITQYTVVVIKPLWFFPTITLIFERTEPVIPPGPPPPWWPKKK